VPRSRILKVGETIIGNLILPSSSLSTLQAVIGLAGSNFVFPVEKSAYLLPIDDIKLYEIFDPPIFFSEFLYLGIFSLK
jgi:hypothetical protein